MTFRGSSGWRALALSLLWSGAVSTAAMAHDFWIQPRDFWLQPQVVTPATIQVGHGPDRQISTIGADRIILFRDVGAQGVTDLHPLLSKGPGAPDFKLSFATPGAHMVALETNSTKSELPSIRFNDYVKAEGIEPIIQYRLRTKQTDVPGREAYSRRAKALFQVGPADARDAALVTRPLGLSLEIVPERNPYTLGANEALPVHILYEGRPLPGALVKLTNLEFDIRPVETHLTDSAGRAEFRVPLKGSWLLNVIWSKPVRNNPQADFETTFSSLSFAFPPRGLHP